MTNFFSKNQNNKSLNEIVKFESKLDQKLLNQKDNIFNKLNKDLFIKENIKIFICHDYLFENVKNAVEWTSGLDEAISVLNDCKEYSWSNIWDNFKKMIYKMDILLWKTYPSMFFRWLLLLIYLNENQKIDLKLFFLIHKKFKKDFENLGLIINNYIQNDSIEFDKEINLDIDKLDNLYLKIKDFFEQLDIFFIKNFSLIVNELNFYYKKSKKKIIQKDYFFDHQNLSKLIKPSHKKYISNFTTIKNNLNLPINYIFIKYLVDNNFLWFKEDLIEKFLQKINQELEIEDTTFLREKIFNFLNRSEIYKEIDKNYIFNLFNDYSNKSLEENIIERFQDMISDLKEYIPVPNN